MVKDHEDMTGVDEAPPSRPFLSASSSKPVTLELRRPVDGRPGKPGWMPVTKDDGPIVLPPRKTTIVPTRSGLKVVIPF